MGERENDDLSWLRDEYPELDRLMGEQDHGSFLTEDENGYWNAIRWVRGMVTTWACGPASDEKPRWAK